MSIKWRNAIDSLPNLLKYLLVLGVVVFISFLFPNNVKFKYQFEQGQTWRYEDLVAPFDFAIRKTDEQLQTEIQELDKDFSPYYELDEDMLEQQQEQFENDFNQQLDQVREGDQFQEVLQKPQRYIDYGEAFLARLYRRGVIEPAEPHRGKGKDFVINILQGNTTQQQTLENLYTVASARAMLGDSLPASSLAEPEFLYPLLENLIQPNLTYNDTLTEKFRRDVLATISTSRGMVRKGDTIVSKGGIITDEVHQKLVSFKRQYEDQVIANKSRMGVFVGYFLLTSLIIGVFVIYLRYFAKEVLGSINQLVFIFFWLIVYSYLVYAVESTDILSAYLIPFCIVPIVIKNFYDGRLALFTHIVVVLIASFLSSKGYEFTFLQILAGIVVLLSDVDTREWSRFFNSIFSIFMVYALAYLGLSLIQEGNLMEVDRVVFLWLFLNVFLTLLAYPLIPLLERLFGFTSSITLVELSDMNRPLLRELAIEAPGTLQHSLQVANLSEAAAAEIGANPLLVKVAALYHDIGKTTNPTFFIENQDGLNPHDDKTDLESARIIISHVEEGVKKAKKARLPRVLTNFIKTHHGTTRVEYFYRNYLKDRDESEVDESLFRYPGPRPKTKEETILMMADSIEAACRSLKNPTEVRLGELIDKIISGKITQGQLDHSGMTFQELERCKLVFKKVMKSMHHGRIEYPEQEEAENKK